MGTPRIRLLVARAAIAVLAGGAIAGGAIAGGAIAGGAARTAGAPRTAGAANTIGAPHSRARPTGRTTVPSVRAVPSTCLVAGRLAPGQTCSIRPCVEFVAPRLQRLLRARSACDLYPIPHGLPVRIRR